MKLNVLLKVVVADKSVSFRMSSIVHISTLAKRCYTTNQFSDKNVNNTQTEYELSKKLSDYGSSFTEHRQVADVMFHTKGNMLISTIIFN